MASTLRAVDMLMPAKLIVQLNAKVFGGVYSFQGMTMDSVGLLNDIAFVGDSQKLTLLGEISLAMFSQSIVGC